MDLAREMPLATRIWAAEIMRGAPMIQDFLDTTLTQWVASRERVVRRWIAAGTRPPVNIATDVDPVPLLKSTVHAGRVVHSGIDRRRRWQEIETARRRRIVPKSMR